MQRLKVLVIGAGAIGTYVGGSLALAGSQIVFLEQPGSVTGLRQRGLTLDLSVDPSALNGITTGQAVFNPPGVEFHPDMQSALGSGPFDFAIFALKSFDTAVAVQAMMPYADRLPAVLCLSNGVENEAMLAAELGEDKVIAGTVTSSVAATGTGNITLERKRGVGLYERHPLALFIQQVLNKAHLNAHLFPQAGSMKWSKMLTNLPGNATAAILDLTPGEVFSDARLFDLEMRMLRETLAVMRTSRIKVTNLPHVLVKALVLGTKLPAFIARPLMQKAVGGGRGGKMPSFHIDLHSGRGRSEIAWLNGAVVRFGQAAGVPTPVNKLLTETLTAMVTGSLQTGSFRHQPEKLLSLL